MTNGNRNSTNFNTNIDIAANGSGGGSFAIEGMRIEISPLVLEFRPGVESRYSNGDKLPGLWITAPVTDFEGNVIDRTYVGAYPSDEYDDPQGEDALYFGGCYYDEGMSYTDLQDHDMRVDCFRAAEILYRHAAGKGNAVANLCLGYVYSYDRCEGKYWPGPSEAQGDAGAGAGEGAGAGGNAGGEAGAGAGAGAGASAGEVAYPREQRAFECLALAAKAGIPEACYKLGDMYKHGTGCDPSAQDAFRWYSRASELSARERPVILGSVALRLADCFEEGFGCNQDFTRALHWYQQAVAGLEAAVEAGEVWYAKALASARAGVKRCKQEVGF